MRLLFEQAWAAFMQTDKELFESNASERCLCGALSQSFRKILDVSEYSDYFVDVEYNRNMGRKKTIVNDRMAVITINCDLIVHSRGHRLDRDNLIAIEMKKAYRDEEEKQKDRERLMALTNPSFDGVWRNDGRRLPDHVCDYQLGVYIEIEESTASGFFEFYYAGRLNESQRFSYC